MSQSFTSWSFQVQPLIENFPEMLTDRQSVGEKLRVRSKSFDIVADGEKTHWMKKLYQKEVYQEKNCVGEWLFFWSMINPKHIM